MAWYKDRKICRFFQAAVCAVLITLVLSCGGAKAIGRSDSAAGQRTREINIVYDDSGSMYNVTSWSQAKYALEVFTAMMNENDTLNIYELSKNGKKSVTLEGKGDAQSNVNVVDALYGCGETFFEAVRNAGDALMESEADEKWLIIITDGAFQHSNDPASEILGFVGQNNTKVVYIAIGSESYVMDMTPYAREMFYPYHTDEENILDTMTSAATLVFNYKPLPIDVDNSGTVTFDADVPLEKIIIFSQGENASIENLGANGTGIQSDSEKTVKVKVDAKSGGAAYGPLARGLNGVVYSVKAEDSEHPFADGKYSFDCSAGNVQVFVEPGVSVKTILRGETGEAINIEDAALREIPEGDWTVEVQLINPLNGQPVSTTDSSILAGAALDVVITDDQGNIKEYGNGEKVSISGEKVELYGRVSFLGMNGIIEKTSQRHSLDVVKGKLYLAFSNPGGYGLDAAMLQPDSDITFNITINGKRLSEEQTDKVKFSVESTNGIAWNVERIDSEGTFRLVPSYAKRRGLSAVSGGETELTVSATMRDQGDKREGTGTVKLNISTETKAGLQLTLTMPQETLTDKSGENHYMFDCRTLGLPSGEPGDKERPYILVEVRALNPDGSVRLLTDEEWDEGVNNFHYRAAERYPSFLWRLAQVFVLGQELNFTAVKGESPSTYKLYLDSGVRPFSKNVLPNTSDLDVTLSYKYDNGAELVGSAEGAVSVMPLPLWTYLIWLIAIITVVLLVAALIVKEVTKPHFPRDFNPNVSVAGMAVGGAIMLANTEYKLRSKRSHRWSLTKPETCSIRVYDMAPDETDINFRFTVIAEDNAGAFRLHRLSELDGFESCIIGGIPYDDLDENDAWRTRRFGRTTRIEITHDFNGGRFTKDIKFR